MDDIFNNPENLDLEKEYEKLLKEQETRFAEQDQLDKELEPAQSAEMPDTELTEAALNMEQTPVVPNKDTQLNKTLEESETAKSQEELQKAIVDPKEYIRQKYLGGSKMEDLKNLQKKANILESVSDLDKAIGQLGSWKYALAKKMGYEVPGYKGGGLAEVAEKEKQKFGEQLKLEEAEQQKLEKSLGLEKQMMGFKEMLQNEEELNNPQGMLATTLKDAAKTLNLELPEGITPKQILRVMPNLATLAETRKTKLSEIEADKELKKQQYEKDIELELLKQKGQKELKQMEMEGKKVQPTEGQKTTDKEFAKKYTNWVAEKGSIGADKGIANIQEAIREMQANPDLTGGFKGVAYALMPEALKSATSEKIGKIETRLRSAVVDTLRPLLGAQFAAVEGERIFKQTFDPNQSMSENIDRAKLVLDDLQRQVESRKKAVEFWEQRGTLEGYQAFTPEQTPAPTETPKPQQFKAGDVRTKNGRDYIRDEEGKWRPVK
jgi:hypothetical protein